MKKHGIIWLAFLTLLVVVLAACAPKAAPTPVPATPAPTPVATIAPTVAVPAPTPVAIPKPPPATPAPTPAVKMPAILSLATAAIGTTSYIAASAFTEVIGKYTPTKIAVEPASISVRWIPLMKTKEIDLAMGCAFTDISDAYYGKFFWKDKGPQPVLQVATGMVQPYGFHVTDPKIKTLADLKGKKIYGYMRNNRNYIDAVAIVLREAGLKPGDVELLVFDDVNEATKGIAEGKAVGLWFVGTVLPLVELDRTKPLYNIPVPKEIADKVIEAMPEFGFMIWKKGEGIGKEDIPYIALPCGLHARADLEEDVVYTLLSTFYAHYDEYKDKHPVMKSWVPELGPSAMPVPMHPGAVKYYKEKGIWKAEQEKLQQKLLAQPRG